MHSRIIELSKNRIEKEERLTVSSYYDNGFIGSVADYVDNCDRKDAIEWLVDVLKSKNVITKFDEEKIVFSETAKENYFKENFDLFKKLSSELTFEQFSSFDAGINLYKLKNCIDDKFSFYIHYNNWYYTLDTFIRDYMKNGETWYFGGALDYHF